MVLNLIRNLLIEQEHEPTMVSNGTEAVVTKPIRPAGLFRAIAA